MLQCQYSPAQTETQTCVSNKQAVTIVINHKNLIPTLQAIRGHAFIIGSKICNN